jgi:hypothetical protein
MTTQATGNELATAGRRIKAGVKGESQRLREADARNVRLLQALDEILNAAGAVSAWALLPVQLENALATAKMVRDPSCMAPRLR